MRNGYNVKLLTEMLEIVSSREPMKKNPAYRSCAFLFGELTRARAPDADHDRGGRFASISRLQRLQLFRLPARGLCSGILRDGWLTVGLQARSIRPALMDNIRPGPSEFSAD